MDEMLRGRVPDLCYPFVHLPPLDESRVFRRVIPPKYAALNLEDKSAANRGE